MLETNVVFAPLLPRTVNIELLTVPGLRPDKMPLVQIPTLPLGVFVVRAESEDKDVLRIHVFNVTNTVVSPGQHQVRILVP